jgi:hypothetical protein
MRLLHQWPGISTSPLVSWPADHATPIAPAMLSRRLTKTAPLQNAAA